MQSMLDSIELQKTFDPSNMLALIENFKQQCEHGERIARDLPLPQYPDFHNVVICGIGGSAIGGDLLRSYLLCDLPMPVEIVRNYCLPKYINQNTLVIVSSYSGNTEEPLAAYREAKERNAQIIGITTGGELFKNCIHDGIPCIQIPSGYPPRAALGYSFIPLLIVFERLGFIPRQREAIDTTRQALNLSVNQHSLNVPTDENFAKQLALRLHGTFPVIYAGQDAFQPVATRWRCQLNENAKMLAHDNIVPEMNHNEILGWNKENDILKHMHVVYLLDEGYHEQIQKRFHVMKSLIQRTGCQITTVHAYGDSLLARIFYTINVGDFVSLYLAYLNQYDPTHIPAIDYLKAAMTQ